MANISIKRIPGFSDYGISNCGKVYKFTFGKHELVTPRRVAPIEDGNYLVVNMYLEGRLWKQGIHRLVLLTYVGPPPEDKKYACHENGDPTDNRLDNLYWGSPKSNSQDMVKHGTAAKGEANGNAKVSELQVAQIKKFYFTKTKQLQQLADEFGLDTSTVNDMVSGETWKHVSPEHTVKKNKQVEAVCRQNESMKPCKNWPGKFITSQGRVFSRRGSALKVLKPHTDRPYLGEYVVLRQKGKRCRVAVAELYDTAFDS